MMLKLETETNIFGTSGSGNQKKAWINNHLIKINSKFKEATKERDAYIIGQHFGLNTLKYEVIQCEYLGQIRNCSICDSFLTAKESSITLYDILNYYNVEIPMNMSSVEYFNIVCNYIHKFTGLQAKLWLMQLLVFDYLIANPDRHLSNIEFIKGENGFRFSPIFDNGQSFFKTDATLTDNQLEQKYRSFKSLPFSRNPKKNLIDINMARLISIAYKDRCKNNSFHNIPVSDARIKILNFMFNKLVNMN